MATKWSTTTDPAQWSIDEVVSYLCDPNDTPWLEFSNSPRPDSAKLEAALRANDVCGVILLALNLDTMKDLGIESLGQRITLMKAVTWLEDQKSKKENETGVVSPSDSSNNTVSDTAIPEFHGEALKKDRRRIAPVLLTEEPQNTNIINLVDQNSAGDRKLTPREEDFYDRLLKKYPASDSLGLAPYGESDTEEELDSETWEEVLEENPQLQSTFDEPELEPTARSKVLSREECENVIQTHTMNEEYFWCRDNLEALSSELDPQWSSMRNSGQIDAEKAKIKTTVTDLELRLQKLTEALLDGKYKSAYSLRSLCPSLDRTISDLSEARWTLVLISTDDLPSKVALAQFEKLNEPYEPETSGTEEDSDEQNDVDSEGESLDNNLEDDYASYGVSDETELLTERLRPHSQPTTEDTKSTDETQVKEGFLKMEYIMSLEDTKIAEHTKSTDETNIKDEPGSLEDFYDMDYILSDGIKTTEDTKIAEDIKIAKDILIAEDAEIIESPDSQDLEDLFETLQNKSFKSIEEEKNRRELLAKLIDQLEQTEIEKLAKLLDEVLPFVFLSRIRHGLRTMLMDRREVPSSDTEDNLFMRITALYFSWHSCRRISPEIGVDKQPLLDALTVVKDEKNPLFYRFFDELKALIQAHERWSHRLDEGILEEICQEVFQDWTSHQPDPLIISSQNPESPILLNSEIARRIKPHQLEGVQFMWRELCESGKLQAHGCLLAHEMGLGKTMQVITVLVTLAECCQSPDPGVREQVPLGLREGRTLVLCPAALVQNWIDELAHWVPKDVEFGQVYSLARSAESGGPNVSDYGQRCHTICEQWGKGKGVLILSYDMFRGLVKTTQTIFSQYDHERVKNSLLYGTELVVADEAHRLTSSVSKVAELARLIGTKYRIAMTGTPLSNNLEEWFHMIDWIDSKYLGTYVQFKKKFVDKISDGLKFDCTQAERRAGLKAQKVLIGILRQKYHRVEISSIEEKLPPKIEIAISIELTDTQVQAYNAFVEEAIDTDLTRGTLSWLSLLQLCCNQPFLFLSHLRKRHDQQLETYTPAATLPLRVPFPPNLIDRIESILEPVFDHPHLISNRWLVLERILQESFRARDKVLVFSQSLSTVHWLECHLQARGHKACRIDGDSDSSERQAIGRNLNAGNDVQVIFISTKAGGIGLNLYGANRVVIFDTTFNPMWENQAIGRAYRIGQTKPVFVYRFRSSGTFEDHLYQQAVAKGELFHSIVNQRDITARIAASKTKWLIPVQRRERQPLDAMMGKDPEVFDQVARSASASIIVSAEVYDFKEEQEPLDADERAEVDRDLAEDAAVRARFM